MREIQNQDEEEFESPQQKTPEPKNANNPSTDMNNTRLTNSDDLKSLINMMQEDKQLTFVEKLQIKNKEHLNLTTKMKPLQTLEEVDDD